MDDLGLVYVINGILTDVHPPSACAANPGGCWIHSPKPHPLATASVRWRDDKQTAERICVHGIGHPDPQDAAYWWTQCHRDVTVHGCDGCCGPLPDWARDVLPPPPAEDHVTPATQDTGPPDQVADEDSSQESRTFPAERDR